MKSNPTVEVALKKKNHYKPIVLSNPIIILSLQKHEALTEIQPRKKSKQSF